MRLERGMVWFTQKKERKNLDQGIENWKQNTIIDHLIEVKRRIPMLVDKPTNDSISNWKPNHFKGFKKYTFILVENQSKPYDTEP